jgi:DNA adenine methylase
MDALPIIPWIGGKRRLASQILPLFPDHTCYVEPFVGAAALFFLKDRVKTEVLNDVNGELINLYRVIKHHLEEFVKQFRWALVSREQWDLLKITRPETLTDVQRAARFYYMQHLAFGAKVEGQNFGTTATTGPLLNLLRIEEQLSAAHIRLAQATIERLDWKACLKRYDRPHTLFYMDPPYWATEGYGVEFAIDEYHAMAELMRTIAGKAIVSVNDVPEMRKAFAGLPMKRARIGYTVGRAGKARAQRGELIIRSWR